MYFSGEKVCVSLIYCHNMVIETSVIEWNDMENIPTEFHPVLLLIFDEENNEAVVSAGMYDNHEKGFIDSDCFDIPRVYENVLAWAEYPTVGIVLNRQGKNQAYVSRTR